MASPASWRCRRALRWRPWRTNHAIGAEKSLVNYSFYLGATNDNLEVIRALPPGAAAGRGDSWAHPPGSCGSKILAGIFRDAPAIIATHCEFSPLIQQNLDEALASYGHEILAEHPNIRSAEACYLSTRLAFSLSKEFKAPLHVCTFPHREGDGPVRDPGPDGRQASPAKCASTSCTSGADDYPRLGNRIKCNPAIKTAADGQALLQALQAGKLDIIATDQCAPHTTKKKRVPTISRRLQGLPAGAGCPVIRARLCPTTGIRRPGIVTARHTTSPAGSTSWNALREGYWADLVIIDTEIHVTSERVLSKCGWSPFEGESFRSSIASTLVNGQPSGTTDRSSRPAQPPTAVRPPA